MPDKDSAGTAQQSSSPSGPGAGAAPDPDPRAIIETGSQGSGTTNDPPPSDTKPPGVADLDDLA